MTNTPFDLEAAKAGKKVQFFSGGGWDEVYVVGGDYNSNIVIRYGAELFSVPALRLRMKTEPRTVWRVIYREGDHSAERDFDNLSEASSWCIARGWSLTPFIVTIEGDDQ